MNDKDQGEPAEKCLAELGTAPPLPDGSAGTRSPYLSPSPLDRLRREDGGQMAEKWGQKNEEGASSERLNGPDGSAGALPYLSPAPLDRLRREDRGLASEKWGQKNAEELPSGGAGGDTINSLFPPLTPVTFANRLAGTDSPYPSPFPSEWPSVRVFASLRLCVKFCRLGGSLTLPSRPLRTLREDSPALSPQPPDGGIRPSTSRPSRAREDSTMTPQKP